MTKFDRLLRLLDLVPRTRRELARDSFRIKEPLCENECFRGYSDVVNMIIPGWMFAKTGHLDCAVQCIPEKSLLKLTHGPTKSLRHKLSSVVQVSKAGRGVSKAISIHTAVGSPGFSETRQTWPTPTGLPPNRPSTRRADQFSPQSMFSNAPPVGVW